MYQKEMSANNNLKYVKLYEWLIARINSGELRYGEKLPSETEICSIFDISRQTVRTAMKFLEKDEYIKRIRGSGTYVAYNALRNEEKQKTVGLLISYFDEYLFPHIFSGIESELSGSRCGIDIAITYNRINNETMFLQRMIDSNVSGVIIEGTKSAFPNPNFNLYKALEQRGIPIIFFHNHYSNIKFSSVEMSDEQSIYLLTEKLIENGHKNIAAIFKYDDFQGIERYKGYIKCMSDNRLKIDDECVKWYSTKHIEYSFSSKSMSSFLKRISNCTALIVYNDEIAVRVLDFFKQKEIKVPEDISMVSVDDTHLARRSDLCLVGAIHPKVELGRKVANNILKMMSDKNWKENDYSFRFPPKINQGNSISTLNIRAQTEEKRFLYV